MVLCQRRGNTDQDCVHVCNRCKLCGGVEAFALGRSNVLRLNAPDVAFAPVQCLYLGCVHVEPGNAEAFTRKQQCERQTDVAQANDADARLAPLYPRLPVRQ